MRSISTLALLSLLTLPLSAQAAKATKAKPQKIELTVTKKGFEPSPVKVKKGQPVTLVITRAVEKTCAKEIVVPGYDINTKLPLNTPVEVSFTPKKSGELKYGCAMDQMIGGVLTVE